MKKNKLKLFALLDVKAYFKSTVKKMIITRVENSTNGTQKSPNQTLTDMATLFDKRLNCKTMEKKSFQKRMPGQLDRKKLNLTSTSH